MPLSGVYTYIHTQPPLTHTQGKHVRHCAEPKREKPREKKQKGKIITNRIKATLDNEGKNQPMATATGEGFFANLELRTAATPVFGAMRQWLL